MFKTYDVRGVFGKEVTPENFFHLGRAFSTLSKKLVVGMDYRRNNMALANALMAGFEGEESFMGVAPTPAIAFSASEAGASITASHNPPEYNGLKALKEKRGFSLEEFALLKKEYERLKSEGGRSFDASEGAGKINFDDAPLISYLQSLPNLGNAIFDLSGGAVCSIKSFFPKAIFSEPDPLFVRHSAEPTPDALSVLVSQTRKENCLGFAFDGDGDRCMTVDSGKILDTGVMMAFYAANFLAKGSKIVLTLDVQQEVFDFLRDNGFHPHYSPVGDVFVVGKAREIGADFAAEKGGHYCIFKHLSYHDGIYFSAVVSQSKPGELNAFASQFKNVFLREDLHNVVVDFKELAEAVKSKNPVQFETMDGVKASFEDYTFLIRASNTQPLVRVSVEAKTREKGVEGLKTAKELVSSCRAG